MSDGFDGFGPGAFAWFDGLERDNSKAYFTATRERYETEVRGALDGMLEELRGTFGGTVKLFRQQRDLRFSADKSPYKTRTYGLLVPPDGVPLYAELSAAGLYAGTGYHQLARDQLARYRDAVADEASGAQLAALVGLARAAGLEVEGEVLRTAPRGFARDHPRVALLRHKAVIVGRRLPPGDGGGIGRDAALEHAAGTWQAAAPTVAWLDAHVGPSTLPPEGRWARR